MSAAPREKTSWLATSYEKLILDVALIVLAALCILLALNLIGGDAASSVRGSGVAQQEGITATEMDPAVWVEKDAAMRSPFQMTIQSNLMLVSQLRVYCVNPSCEKPIAFNAAKCPFCQAAQPSREDIAGMDYDGDGMPDQFEKKFGLNPYDPGDSALDLDGDGFSNVEEFQNKTDPTDPEDHPSPAAKLRMVRMVVKPFFLRFQGVSELATGKSFLLNLRSADKSHFAKLGAVVEGYKVAAYDEATSILTLEKDGKSLQLKKNEPITAKEFIAALVSLLDGRQYQVRVNDAIDVKGRPHKVIDINPSHVLIEDEQTQKQIQVPPLTEEERMILRGISEPSAMQAEPGAVESAAAQFPPPAEP